MKATRTQSRKTRQVNRQPSDSPDPLSFVPTTRIPHGDGTYRAFALPDDQTIGMRKGDVVVVKGPGTWGNGDLCLVRLKEETFVRHLFGAGEKLIGVYSRAGSSAFHVKEALSIEPVVCANLRGCSLSIINMLRS